MRRILVPDLGPLRDDMSKWSRERLFGLRPAASSTGIASTSVLGAACLSIGIVDTFLHLRARYKLYSRAVPFIVHSRGFFQLVLNNAPFVVFPPTVQHNSPALVAQELANEDATLAPTVFRNAFLRVIGLAAWTRETFHVRRVRRQLEGLLVEHLFVLRTGIAGTFQSGNNFWARRLLGLTRNDNDWPS